MDKDELARKVAAELGPQMATEVDREIASPAATRAFGLTEAGFLVACAQIAIQIWSARQDRALLDRKSVV